MRVLSLDLSYKVLKISCGVQYFEMDELRKGEEGMRNLQQGISKMTVWIEVESLVSIT